MPYKSTQISGGADVSIIFPKHREVKFTGHLFSKGELFFNGRHNLKALFRPRARWLGLRPSASS